MNNERKLQTVANNHMTFIQCFYAVLWKVCSPTLKENNPTEIPRGSARQGGDDPQPRQHGFPKKPCLQR